jgi:putative ABC transport system permease protein
MNVLGQDFRYAFRQLRKNPGFAITAILTLALGIGATTAVFSVAYGVLIDPFPYKDVHTLATPKICTSEWPRCGWNVYTPAQWREIQDKTTLFDGVTASTISDVALTGLAEPLRLRGNYITPNTFSVLGVQPILGRETNENDVRPGAGEVVLLSYRCWKAHFGGDPHVLGRVLTLNSHPRTVIGVMPPRFLWRGGDVYLPINMTTAGQGDQVQGQTWFSLVGRLKPGVTDAQAAAQLKPIFDDFAKTSPRNFPKDIHDWRLGIMTFDLMFQSGLASTLYLILGAVFVLLLIACINVSSLLLARAVSRGHEFVVRAAIGASRWRLVRYTLTESLLLAFAAMPVALLFAYAGLQATLRIIPTETIPDEAVVTMNLPVLFASLGLALFTVVVFGMAPAWHSANPRLAAVLGSGVRSSGSIVQRRLLSGFVVTEIALSLALLMLAGLMVRSLLATLSVPVAFDPGHTLLMRVPLDDTRYPTAENRLTFWRQFLGDAKNVPGVKTVTLDVGVPGMRMFTTNVQIAGQPLDKRRIALHLITPDYLAAAGRKVIQGHFIDDREIVDKAHEVVVSEDFAKRYFSGENVLGRVIHLPELLNGDGKDKLKDDAFTVVGEVQDLPAPAYLTETVPHVFIPYSIVPAFADTVIVSTALPASDMANALRRVVHNIDRDQPVTDVMSLGQMLDMYGYASPRFTLALFGTFAVAALALSLVGIYGVLSFITSQRTQEIGIRMALGARPGHVMWMVLRQACILAAFGVLVGLPLAFFAGRFAKDELVQTSQRDPLTLVLAILILPLLAVAGTWLPARRAAAIDPVRALRSE